jgi:ATP-dependent RNA helicase RhlE
MTHAMLWQSTGICRRRQNKDKPIQDNPNQINHLAPSLHQNTAMVFAKYNLAPEIKENLAELGFKKPTDIQFKAIPNVLKGEDLLAIAQTGTGKTAAFAIPVIHLIHERKRSNTSQGIRCVVMVPTRELALQITQVFQKIGRNTRVKTLCVFGGVEQDPQIARLQKGIDILITTPGRMFDLTHQGHIDLKQVEILILDEADKMLADGFLHDIEHASRILPRHRQTLFFSATINERIKTLAYSLVRNAIRIQLSPKDPVSKNIRHAVVFIQMDDKRFFLERFIKEHEDVKLLVFVRTKVRAERVMAAMARVGVVTETLHGDKEQSARQDVMQRFRDGRLMVLIATDVSARGVDIADVQWVINYDLPDIAENYVHRVGRTGRGMNKGDAISFCSDEERPVLAEIEEYLTQPIKVLKLTKTDYSDTLSLTEDVPDKMAALKREIEEAEAYKKKRKKR